MADTLITIASDKLTIRINQTGAELWSITDHQACEYMTDADPAFWTGHAPILFPVVGSVAHDRILVDGREYPMQRHGFARHAQFDVVEQGADHVRLRLRDSAETRVHFPFAFQLEMSFRITQWHLETVAHVTNPGDAPLPFSFGYHPAFAWPLPGGAAKSAHHLMFASDEPEPIRRIDRVTGLVFPDAYPTPVKDRELPLDSALFEADAIIWDHQNSRALSYGAPGGASLDLAFPDSPMLGVWQIPGAHYICIEPWQGHADPEGFTGEFATKPGVVILPPGDTHSLHLSVTVHPS